MKEIKMSDVFQLPITAKLVNGDARLLISGSGHLITSFSGMPNAAMHMANAINSYDANQDRIAELEYAIQRISGMEDDEGRFDSDDALAEAFNICREVK